MSQSAYIGVDGIARKIKKMYVGVDNKARKVKKGYVGVGGIARIFFSDQIQINPNPLRGPRAYMSSAKLGDYGLIAGGSGPSGRTLTAEAYDSNLTVTQLTDLSYRHDWRRQVATAGYGSYMIFAAGTDDVNKTNSRDSECYDINLTKRSVGSLDKWMFNGKGGSVAGYALFAGGVGDTDGDDPNHYLSTVYTYSENLVRSSASNLSKARCQISSVTVGNYVVFCGGFNGQDGYPLSSTLSVADAYNSSLVKTSVSSLYVAQYDPPTATIGNYGLVGKGKTSSTQNTQPTTIEYYTSSLVHSKLGATITEEMYNSATTTNNKVVLFAGGQYLNSAINKWESVDTILSVDSNLVVSSDKKLNQTKSCMGAFSFGSFSVFLGGSHVVDGVSTIVDDVEVFTYT